MPVDGQTINARFRKAVTTKLLITQKNVRTKIVDNCMFYIFCNELDIHISHG
jgi:hypothetical protein